MFVLEHLHRGILRFGDLARTGLTRHTLLIGRVGCRAIGGLWDRHAVADGLGREIGRDFEVRERLGLAVLGAPVGNDFIQRRQGAAARQRANKENGQKP